MTKKQGKVVILDHWGKGAPSQKEKEFLSKSIQEAAIEADPVFQSDSINTPPDEEEEVKSTKTTTKENRKRKRRKRKKKRNKKEEMNDQLPDGFFRSRTNHDKRDSKFSVKNEYFGLK